MLALITLITLGGAQAADDTLTTSGSDSSRLTITGLVQANTCTLSSGSKEQIITLSNITDREIKEKGIAGGQDVMIVLSDCGADATAVVVRPWGEADKNDSSAFKNTVMESEGGATGVGLYFYPKDGTSKFSPDGTVSQTSKLNSLADNILIYRAAYAGTGANVVAGKFSTIVNMNFEYQ